MNEFHVLILDDSPELIEAVGRRIRLKPPGLADTNWKVIFHKVHIKVVSEDGRERFSEETFSDLITACRQKPNLILADYGYSSPGNIGLPPGEYFEKALSPQHLVQDLQDFLKRKYPSDRKLARQIQSNFITNPCRLYLYTYTGKEFQGAPPTPEARAALTEQAFQHSDVVLVDVSLELYQNDAFSGEDKHFRAYLTAGLLAQIIYRELLIHIIAYESKRLRFIRYYRSEGGIFVIVLIGGAIGAVGEWLGARIMGLTLAGLGAMALVLSLLAGIAFFIFGLAIPLIFERVMSNLLRKVKSKEVNEDFQ